MDDQVAAAFEELRLTEAKDFGILFILVARTPHQFSAANQIMPE